MRFVVLCVAFLACGGKVAGDDGGAGGVDGGGGPKSDAQPAVDVGQPTQNCTPMNGGGTVSSDGSCTSTSSWSCGDTKYSIDCACPKNQCICTEETANGSVGHIVTPQSLCPGCSSNLAALCGFPTK